MIDRYSYWYGFGMGATFALFVAAMLSLVRDARADDRPDTQSLMARVEAILIANGYETARGYAELTPPNVFSAPWRLPGGAWGYSVPGTVLLSEDQPRACLRITLAHELAHDATRRRDLLSADSAGAPAWAIKAEMERIAAIVEHGVAEDRPWVPNCLMRRGVK